jgi:hypothetical protein
MRLKAWSLISLGICAIGYLGLAVSHVWVYSVVGMTWSLVVFAAWATTVTVAFRRCGRQALWLLLEAPVVLLPFYAILFADL